MASVAGRCKSVSETMNCILLPDRRKYHMPQISQKRLGKPDTGFSKKITTGRSRFGVSAFVGQTS
jgi:hypothetical protein